MGNTIGNKIYELRRQKDFSQEKLGEFVGVSRQAISKWELGEALPNSDKLAELCKVFDVSADYFLFDKTNEEKVAAEDVLTDEVSIATQVLDEVNSKTNASKSKRHIYKKIALIIGFCLVAFVIIFACIITGVNAFSSNKGKETDFFLFFNIKQIVWCIMVVVTLIVVIAILFLLLRKKK